MKAVLDKYNKERVVEQFTSCYNIIEKSTDQFAQMIEGDLKKTAVIEGKKYEYFEPDQIYKCLPKIPVDEVKVALKVIHQYLDEIEV